LNAEPKQPRKRPRLLWLILVDLLAAYLPWLLLISWFEFESVVIPYHVSFGSYWAYLLGPVFSPVMAVGISTLERATGFFGVAGSVGLIHFALAVFVQRKFPRWLKYLVPLHLFTVSAIPVGRGVWLLYGP